MIPTTDEELYMRAALTLAHAGEGFVEPNPMVGCVLVKNQQIVGEGWHENFGGPHAEVNAIRAATESLNGATAYVTLEPCAHQGKTPPCTLALIESKIARVVVAHLDPNPLVAGAGVKQLQDAGIDVEVGLCHSEAAHLLAPYLKRVTTGLPWIIVKWAMTLDGKIASASGDSQWISNPQSREIVHQLRQRVDAIMVGSKTAARDDPLLTARVETDAVMHSSRIATRVVVDSRALLSSQSRLCQTTSEFPTIIAAGPDASQRDVTRLRNEGCEVWQNYTTDPNLRLLALLRELSCRGMTNVLVEGGGGLLGSLHDLNQIDETHVFIGPKLIGGLAAITPLAGLGQPTMAHAAQIKIESVQQIDDDVYIRGRRYSGLETS